MPQDRRAAVVTPFFTDRDAVCNDVRHGARVLRGNGWDARIFAVGGASEREPILPLAEMKAFLKAPEDLVYYHFSTGRSEVTAAIAPLRCRKWLKFHNITPPELFSMWSDELAEASRVGRREMEGVARLGWERVWADSGYNLGEIAPLLPSGTPAEVLAPFHEIDALLEMRRVATPMAEPPRILAVGRIVQSKGHPFLLRVMHYLVHTLGVRAHLDIVGKPDHRLVAYLRMLELMARELRIDPFVTFHGEVSENVLAERYAAAALFLGASEHEGFCVPIVEAMAFGVPVVALATTAVPETVGDAGIVWEERDPRRFAVTIQRLLDARDEREWLAEQGRRRYAESFSNPMIERRMLETLGSPAPFTPGR